MDRMGGSARDIALDLTARDVCFKLHSLLDDARAGAIHSHDDT